MYIKFIKYVVVNVLGLFVFEQVCWGNELGRCLFNGRKQNKIIVFRFVYVGYYFEILMSLFLNFLFFEWYYFFYNIFLVVFVLIMYYINILLK